MTDGQRQTPRTALTGISTRAYEHPASQTALAALKNLRGFDLLLRKIHGLAGEPRVRMQYLSSAVRVGPKQFARLHGIKSEVVRVLDLPFEPELYVQSLGEVNAITLGMDKPFIVMSTELLDAFDDEELLFVLGHEAAHAFSGHSTYQTLAAILASVGLSSFPVAGLAVSAVEAALQDWSRKSELSCDRAGLLVSQDVGTSVRALMKLAAGSHVDEMDPVEFLEQAAEFELGTTRARDKISKFFMPSGTHPILVTRASQLDRWVRSGEYGRIVDQHEYPLRKDDKAFRVRDAVPLQREEWRNRKLQKKEDQARRLLRIPTPYSVGGAAEPEGDEGLDQYAEIMEPQLFEGMVEEGGE